MLKAYRRLERNRRERIAAWPILKATPKDIEIWWYNTEQIHKLEDAIEAASMENNVPGYNCTLSSALRRNNDLKDLINRIQYACDRKPNKELFTQLREYKLEYKKLYSAINMAMSTITLTI